MGTVAAKPREIQARKGPMNLPRPFPPMEARLVHEIPEGDNWQYEPKWDGFRCLVFRDGKTVELQAKSGQPLTRYFPELAQAFLKLNAEHFALDGEIAVPVGGRFSFNDLLQRIHPANSRVQKLARQHPATFIAFDLLERQDGKDLVGQPLRERRRALEKFATKFFPHPNGIRLSPATSDLNQAKAWFKTVGNDLDGIVAKRADLPYQSGQRTGMQKVKLVRTADCVIGGFRYAAKQKVIGSLLLGLYDDSGLLHHVGFCSGLKTAERKSLTPKLEALIKPPGLQGTPRAGSAVGARNARWNGNRSSLSWSSKSPMTISPADDFVTARVLCGGGRTKTPSNVVWTRSLPQGKEL